MAVSNEYSEFIKERLDHIGEIFMRRMFGGMGIYSDQIFFAIMSDNVLYFKVDDSNLPDYESAGMEPFRPFGDDRAMQYYEVPAEVIEDALLIKEWADKAINVARRAAKKKSLKKRPSKKSKAAKKNKK